MTAKQYKYLTPDQVDSFMRDGYLRIEGAFSREKAAEWTQDVWTRLGMDPDDPSTWTEEWTNMPSWKSEAVETFSPRAWGAIGELVGGHDRIHPEKKHWNDGLIVNLGKAEYVGEAPPDPKSLEGWHCDGDFFLHFLDSPEQALLVVPLFTDIKPQGGGTFIAPDSIGKIAGYLADHPEGVMPTGFDFRGIRDSCTQFVELTGNVGDVVLMHPFMMHSKSHNSIRIPRMITNPPVSLLEPFVYFRTDPSEYSLVELKTLKELGRDPLNGGGGLDFQIAQARRGVVPKRLEKQGKWKVEMEERMRVRQMQLAQQQQQQTQAQTPAQAQSQAQGVVA